MSGKKSRDKGKRRELELVHLFEEWGLPAQRVPLSGATGYAKHDVEVCTAVGYDDFSDATFSVECHAREKLPKWLTDRLDAKPDFIALKANGRPWVFVIPEAMMREYLTE